MPSSYTPSLRVTLPATGENAGTWGTLVNTGITQIIEDAIAGYVSIAMSDANYTLTTANGSTDEARNMFVRMTGALTANRNVTCPTAEKLYFFKNSTTGGFALTLKTAAGTGVSVPNGSTAVLMCDGTNVIDATSYMSSLTLGSALPATSGGTGASSYTIGDINYASTTTALSKLAIGTNNYVLTSNGSIPTWTQNTGTGLVMRQTSPAFSGGTGTLELSSGTLGFTTGAGGSVTQTPSLSSGVTLNKPCGSIQTAGGSISAGSSATFSLTNSTIGASDAIIFSWGTLNGATVHNIVLSSITGAGTATITLSNPSSSSSFGGAAVLKFVVIKGSSS